MAHTAQNQAKIDAAQKRLDAAKATYQIWTASYNDWTSSVQKCYNDPFQDANAASTWYNPTKGPCTGKGSCDLSNCKNVIDKINGTTIPGLRAAYNELVAAQANYNSVLSAVITEEANDPANVLANHVADANAKANTYKWIFAIVVVVVVSAAVFIWYKWFRKK